MTFLLATVVFPALLVGLALGAGLLVERAGGWRIPGVLLVPLGLAALIGVGQMLTWKPALAAAAPPAMWAIGAVGLAVGRRRLRDARPDWWAVAAGVGAYVVLCAPVLFAGRPTFGGYLLDTTAGIQLVGAELLVEHGRDFSAIPDSALRGALESYLGAQYPSGGHVLLGGVGRPFPVSLIWLYEPYIALMAAVSALPLNFLLRRGGVPRWLAATGALAGATPALVYAYVQQGSIKEITVLPLVLMLGCLLVLTRDMWRAGPRGTIPFAVVAAGGIGAIGLAFSAWLGLVALAALAIGATTGEPEQRRPRAIAWRIAPAALLLVVLAIPTFAGFSEAFGVADAFDQGNAVATQDPGNLLRPLPAEQVAGIWLTGAHRLDPGRWFQETYLLIGVALAAALLGVGMIVRRRLVELGAFAVACLIVWWVLTRKGTIWTDAKLLVISSPVVMLLAFLGAANLVRGGFRAAGAGLAILLVGGVLLSDALTYHETNLAPTGRFDELLDIGQDYAGQGPALVPDFDEYAFYALRDMAPDGPGFASRTARLGVQRDGAPTGYGHSYDLDSLPSRAVRAYPVIIMRRSPERSRPPSGFVRAFQGDWYEVWVRRERPDVLVHEPGGSGLRPESLIRCATVRGTARRAGGDGSLRYPSRTRTVVLAPARTKHSLSWPKLPEGIALGGPGDLRARFDLARSGRQLLWFKGEFSRPAEVRLDGRRVGEVAYESGGEGNYARPLEVSLGAGSHVLQLSKGGGTLHPGDAAPSRLLAIVVQPVDQETVNAEAASRWKPLCERPLDWLEAVRPGSQPLARVP
jgi:hypothetical protein